MAVHCENCKIKHILKTVVLSFFAIELNKSLNAYTCTDQSINYCEQKKKEGKSKYEDQGHIISFNDMLMEQGFPCKW